MHKGRNDDLFMGVSLLVLVSALASLAVTYSVMKLPEIYVGEHVTVDDYTDDGIVMATRHNLAEVQYLVGGIFLQEHFFDIRLVHAKRGN